MDELSFKNRRCSALSDEIERRDASTSVVRRSLMIGIDPGVTGAIAFFDAERPDIVETYDLPTVAGVVDGRNLRALIEEFGPTRATIEDAHSMPRQGVASTFKYGRAFGTAIGICEGAGLSIAYVSPSRWKRYYRLDNTGERSRRLALDLFPTSAAQFARKRDHNRAEAALIARWGAIDSDPRLRVGEPQAPRDGRDEPALV